MTAADAFFDKAQTPNDIAWSPAGRPESDPASPRPWVMLMAVAALGVALRVMLSIGTVDPGSTAASIAWAAVLSGAGIGAVLLARTRDAVTSRHMVDVVILTMATACFAWIFPVILGDVLSTTAERLTAALLHGAAGCLVAGMTLLALARARTSVATISYLLACVLLLVAALFLGTDGQEGRIGLLLVFGAWLFVLLGWNDRSRSLRSRPPDAATLKSPRWLVSLASAVCAGFAIEQAVRRGIWADHLPVILVLGVLFMAAIVSLVDARRQIAAAPTNLRDWSAWREEVDVTASDSDAPDPVSPEPASAASAPAFVPSAASPAIAATPPVPAGADAATTSTPSIAPAAAAAVAPAAVAQQPAAIATGPVVLPEGSFSAVSAWSAAGGLLGGNRAFWDTMVSEPQSDFEILTIVHPDDRVTASLHLHHGTRSGRPFEANLRLVHPRNGAVSQTKVIGRPYDPTGPLGDVPNAAYQVMFGALAATVDVAHRSRIDKFDQVTGLPDSRAIQSWLESRNGRTRRTVDRPLLVVVEVMSLPDFDSADAATRNIAIIETAHRMRSIVRDGDFVAMVDGPYLMACVNNVVHGDEWYVMNRIETSVHAAVTIGDTSLDLAPRMLPLRPNAGASLNDILDQIAALLMSAPEPGPNTDDAADGPASDDGAEADSEPSDSNATGQSDTEPTEDSSDSSDSADTPEPAQEPEPSAPKLNAPTIPAAAIMAPPKRT